MIAIIKYNAGNVRSVQNAFNRLGVGTIVTEDLNLIEKADKVIFPGVGQGSSAMHFLQQKGLHQLIPRLQQPVLGICLGQQLMCKHLAEGNVEGLGIFDVDVKAFPKLDLVPHMGWNSIHSNKGALFHNISDHQDVYFVHSYYCEVFEPTSSVCEYILPFSAGLEKDNFYATQFHPEKSGKIGAQILENFLQL